MLYVPRFQKWVKKGATGQSFIRKEITTYRIGTLVAIVEINFVIEECYLVIKHLHSSSDFE